MTKMPHFNQPHSPAAEISREIPPEQDLAPLVAIGGLLTVKQLFGIYAPLLATDRESQVSVSDRFIAPPKRGLGKVDEIRSELTEKLEELHDRLGNKRMHIVGHSLGGFLATIIAVERPDLAAEVTVLGSVHSGFKKTSPGAQGLRQAVGNPPEAVLLEDDNDFMQDHLNNMAKDWPEGVPFNVVSTPFDFIVVPPQGYGVELAHGEPNEHLVIPYGIGVETMMRRWRQIPDSVKMMRSLIPVEHVFMPLNPQIIRHVNRTRRDLSLAQSVPRPKLSSVPLAA